jgi:hypothetical protein
MRRSLAALAVLVIGGCGSSEQSTAPPPARTWRVHWHETARIAKRPVVVTEVTRVRLGPKGFAVTGSVRNLSATTIDIVRPSLPAGAPAAWTWFGITVSRGGPHTFIDHADAYSPPLPASLPPGARWSGTFSGPPVPRGAPAWHVTFGIFEPEQRSHGLPERFAWVSDHSISDTLPPRR